MDKSKADLQKMFFKRHLLVWDMKVDRATSNSKTHIQRRNKPRNISVQCALINNWQLRGDSRTPR